MSFASVRHNNFSRSFLFPQSMSLTTTTPATSGAITVVSPVTKDTLNGPTELSVSPIAPVDDAHANHTDVGEVSMADAKSDSGTTAVADPEVTADIMNTPIHSPNQEREQVKGKPAALPSTPAKGQVFPSVAPSSSPSRFDSPRGSGKKKRTFLAKLKEIFKSDKDKDKSAREKVEKKT